MYKGVYFGTFGYGELIPPMKMVEELIKLGHTIVCYSTSQYQPLIESSGAIYKDYGLDNDETFKKLILKLFKRKEKNQIDRNDKQIINMTIGIINEYMYLKYKSNIDLNNIDYIITNNTNGWGALLAKDRDIPIVYTHSGFAYYDELMTGDYSEDFLKNHCEEIYKNVNYNKIIHILFFNKKLQPLSDLIGDSYHFVGSTIHKRIDAAGKDNISEDEIADENIYISMGSSQAARDNSLNFFLTCIEAFKSLPNQIILDVGSNNKQIIIDRLGSIAPNIMLLAEAPQFKILKKSKLFLTCGGLGSCLEALYFGAKMIIIPNYAHQFVVAKVMEDKLLGLVSKIDITKNELLNLYYEIDSNKIIENNCKEYQKIIINENGGEKGADVLISFLKTQSQIR